MFSGIPNIIDLEASSLSSDSYPIEVGVVLHTGERYCALIMPDESWQDWDLEAEKVHQITKDVLQKYGKPVDKVVDELNALLGNQTVYSDGWVVDDSWVKKLFYTAHKSPTFTVSTLELILTEDQMGIWHETKNKLLKGHEKERHRASFDAALIQKTFIKTRKQTNLKQGLLTR